MLGGSGGVFEVPCSSSWKKSERSSSGERMTNKSRDEVGMGCVDELLQRSFYRLGVSVGRNPGYYIVVPVLLACICITGYQQLHNEIDPEYLFSPVNGPGKHERAIVEEHFPLNYSHRFNLARITRPGRFGHVIIVPKARGGAAGNLLSVAAWAELRELDQLVRNVSGRYADESHSFEEICARWLDRCSENDILNLDALLPDFERGEQNLTFPLMFNHKTWDYHIFPVYFGGSVVENGLLKSVPALQLGYFLRVDTPRQDAIGGAWEEAFLRAVGEAEESGRFKQISVARFASKTLELEFEENTKTIVPYYTLTFCMMAGFSVITCMMADWVRSKPWLGLLGNFSAVMATAAAFGLCCYCGVSFIGINLAAPFLMVGIGIDDTFVMLAAWRRTSIRDPVPKRMGQMLSEAAVSITITSLTDMVSFFIGVCSPFPSVRIFCIYSGVAVLFTFLCHLTFFTGCVAVSGYCELGNRHSVLCHRVQPVSKAGERSWLYRVLCTGGVDPSDPGNPLDNPEHGCMSWFRDHLAGLLCRPLCQLLVVSVFCIYVAGAVYGLTTIEEGLDRRKLSRQDSYSIEFYDREERYFREYPYRVQVIVSGQLDYSNASVQRQVEELVRQLEASRYMSSKPEYGESWLRSFLEYQRDNAEYNNGSVARNESEFVAGLREWLSPGSSYSLDVRFEGEHIVAGRFLVQGINITTTNQEKEMVQELRAICANATRHGLNASVFHAYFVFFDQYELVGPTAIQGMIFGALTMMLISFIFIPNVLCCFWVAFCIVSIELGVAGYMALWDVHLDSISMINLIMCIGFSVDFTAHISYAYMSSSQPSPGERVRESLYVLGLPIVQGALSTILGLLALLLANTYIFLVFFKVVFLVIAIGALHGLILLPVLMSLFGSLRCGAASARPPPQPPQPPQPGLYVIACPKQQQQQQQHIKLESSSLEERDQGIGTSEDSNSSESGASSSHQSPGHQALNGIAGSSWRRSVAGLPDFSPSSPTLGTIIHQIRL